MRDFQQILQGFDALRAQGCAGVLASVLRVEGSTSRRAGARALFGPDDDTAGLISGGCLEGDLALRAREVLADGMLRGVRYDSNADDDRLFGLGLGCRGVVEVLLERVDADSPGPLAFLRRCHVDREAGVLVTRVECPMDPGRVRVSRWTLAGNGPLSGPPLPADERRALEARAREVRNLGRSHCVSDSSRVLLFEWLPRRPRLLLLGAGPDARPLVRLGSELGWQVELVDARAGLAKRERFPQAHSVVHGEPQETLARLEIDPRTAVVVMNHHYERDRACLRALLDGRAGYVGVLGPRARTAEMLDELRKEGVATRVDPWTFLRAPAGLDLGADSADEVALAIVAEIQAVLAGHPGGSLRDRNAPIHEASS